MTLKELLFWDEAHSLDYTLNESDWQEIEEPNKVLFNTAQRIRGWLVGDWQPIHIRTRPFTLRTDYESQLAIIYQNPNHKFQEPGKASIREVLHPNLHSLIEWRRDNIDDRGTTQLRLEREINETLSPTTSYCKEILLMFNKLGLEEGRYVQVPQRVPIIGGKGRLVGEKWEVQPQILVADLILVNQLEELQAKLPYLEWKQQEYQRLTTQIEELSRRQPLL